MKPIPLTRGFVTLVDDADYASVACHKWYALLGHLPTKTFYAARHDMSQPGKFGKVVLLHRVLL